MKKIVAALMILQGVLMSGEVEMLQIKGVQVPVIFEQDKKLPIVSLQLVFLSAGSIEDGDTAGLARFSAKMLAEGTDEMSSADFAKALEQKAINFGVNAGTETLVFELSSLKEEFNFGVLMLQKTLTKPNLSKEAFSKVRAQTEGVILDKKSDFDYVASTNLRALMYENSVLSEPALGTEQSLKKIDIQKIHTFIKSHIDLSNLIIVIGGDIDKASVISSLTKLLSPLEIGKKREFANITPSAKKREKTEIKPSEQAYIYFGAPFAMRASDEESYKAKVAGFILGESGFGSRLMDEIRVKRGLAYSAYGRFSTEKSTSSFIGYLQTKNQSANESIEIVKKVVKEFTQNGAKEKELEQAKKFLLGSEPLRVETLSQRLSLAFFEYYRGYELGHFKKELKLIEALNLKDLNSFIKAHQEINDLSFSIVTNADNKSKR